MSDAAQATAGEAPASELDDRRPMSGELDPDTVQGVAGIIARWDYVTSTGQQPDSEESLVLPPHVEVAGAVIGWLGSNTKPLQGADVQLDAARAALAELRDLMPNHNPMHDSTGGHRGILRGTNEGCVCGAQWVSHGEKWECPRAAILSRFQDLDASAARFSRKNLVAAAYQALERDCGVWSPHPEAEAVADAILKGTAHV